MRTPEVFLRTTSRGNSSTLSFLGQKNEETRHRLRTQPHLDTNRQSHKIRDDFANAAGILQEVHWGGMRPVEFGNRRHQDQNTDGQYLRGN